MDTRRDFVYVDDLVDVAMKAVDGGGASGVYHVSSGSRRLDQGALRRDDQGDGPSDGRRGRGAAAQPGRRAVDPARPVEDRARLRLAAKTPLEEGVAQGRRVLPRARRRARRSRTSSWSSTSPSRVRRRTHAILVVGGAGFVGSNLVRTALERGARSVLVVDNLLSAERENLPDDARVQLSRARSPTTRRSPTLTDDFDYVFHLATYHGNQSSIANPLEDHANNLVTTLKLFEHLKGSRRLRKLVYSASGCTLAPHEVYDEAAGDAGGRAGAARPRQPVPDLEGRRRVLLGLLPPAGGPADGARALPERLRPRRDPRRGPSGAARSTRSGATSRRRSSTAR